MISVRLVGPELVQIYIDAPSLGTRSARRTGQWLHEIDRDSLEIDRSTIAAISSVREADGNQVLTNDSPMARPLLSKLREDAEGGQPRQG